MSTLISSTPQGVLADDPDVARWTPVSIGLAVPAGFGVTVIAQIGLDSALWMAVYDEGIGGAQGTVSLAPLFSDKTTLVIVGTVLAGRTFTIGILPNGGWQRPDVKIVVHLTTEVS